MIHRYVFKYELTAGTFIFCDGNFRQNICTLLLEQPYFLEAKHKGIACDIKNVVPYCNTRAVKNVIKFHAYIIKHTIQQKWSVEPNMKYRLRNYKGTLSPCIHQALLEHWALRVYTECVLMNTGVIFTQAWDPRLPLNWYSIVPAGIKRNSPRIPGVGAWLCHIRHSLK